MPKKTMIQAINETLMKEMEKDETIVLLGQDIGENGGVFRVTDGLLEKFGKDRVIDTPLAESGIIGAAVGMSMNGFKTDR